MSDVLYHHGVKGQKWGVRRYQNKDGSLTPEGIRHYRYRQRAINAGKTKQYVDEIISTMNSDEKDKLALDESGDYLTFEDGCSVAKRILEKDGDIPISFFDMFEDDDNALNLVIGTRSGDKYRGKGYARKAAKRGMNWYEKNKEKYGYKKIVWGVRVDNEPSIRLAKSLGFKYEKGSESDDKKWVNYVRS